MGFQGDSLIARIEQEVEPSLVRDIVVEHLMDFVEDDNDDRLTLNNYFDDRVASAEDYTEEEMNTLLRCQEIFKQVYPS